MSRLRIILADDHESVRQGLRALFQSMPEVEVVHDAANGDDAIHAIRMLAPDLVIIDLSMAPTDGLTVMKRIKEIRRQTKVVVLTRFGEHGYVREAMAAGASAYVLKQSPFSELQVAVLAVARGEQHLDARLWGSGSPKPLADAFPLTDREVAVLRRSALGDSNGDVAAGLDIAVKTVDGHKSNAMKKLGLRSRADLIRYAFLHGWLDDV